MKFVNIRYEGVATYKDRTALKNEWQPGDEKLVSERDAKQLLGYLEFTRVEDKPKKAAKTDDTAQELAQQAQAEVNARERKAKKLAEGEMLEIEQMDKDALEAYARANHAVDLDKRRSIDTLRNQVVALAQAGR